MNEIPRISFNKRNNIEFEVFTLESLYERRGQLDHSIEAATAAECEKGFDVVVGEIKGMANRKAHVTVEIKENVQGRAFHNGNRGCFLAELSPSCSAGFLSDTARANGV